MFPGDDHLVADLRPINCVSKADSSGRILNDLILCPFFMCSLCAISKERKRHAQLHSDTREIMGVLGCSLQMTGHLKDPTANPYAKSLGPIRQSRQKVLVLSFKPIPRAHSPIGNTHCWPKESF